MKHDITDVNEYNIIKLNESMYESWDKFVNSGSINGTFLQTRNFLNYHPIDRFQDCSLLVCKNQNVNYPHAVIPACEYYEDGIKVFHSHLGSTFGGLIIGTSYYKVKIVSDMLDSFNLWLSENGYGKAVLRVTPDIFAKCDMSLLQYLLWNKGYEQYTELSSYIDLLNYNLDIISNFSRGKKGHIKRCMKQNLIGRIINTTEDIEIFYELLCENLLKYKTKPVHSIMELYDLKQRLGDIVTFYGIYDSEQLVAGTMLFFFENTNTYHLQYTCAKQDVKEYSPMNFLYYKLIELSQEQNCKALSFGISTEQKGRVFNMALAIAKEEYGSSFALNRTFYKRLTR